jgi:hypothetical protein
MLSETSVGFTKKGTMVKGCLHPIILRTGRGEVAMCGSGSFVTTLALYWGTGNKLNTFIETKYWPHSISCNVDLRRPETAVHYADLSECLIACQRST